MPRDTTAADKRYAELRAACLDVWTHCHSRSESGQRASNRACKAYAESASEADKAAVMIRATRKAFDFRFTAPKDYSEALEMFGLNLLLEIEGKIDA